LTSSSDTKIGTGTGDAFTGTSTTYTAGDIIVDAGVGDADTLTITATGDISATPFVVGIETVNFAINTVDASGDATFTVEADNIATSGITISATKAGNIITTADVNDVKSGVTVTSGLATIDISTAANADVAIVGTRAAGTSIVQTGTADTITVTTTGALTANAGNDAFTAEESVTLISGGAVTLDDATAAVAGDDVDYTITAAGAITVTRIADTGNLSATTTTGNITITRADSDGDVTLSTGRGNVTVTNADAATGTLTVTATGDNDSNVSGADGTITVTSADGTTEAVLTASAGITITSMDSATDATLTAGAASTLADIDALANLTISSTSSSSTAVTFTVAATEGAALETITATGSKSITFVMGGDDMVAAVTATGEEFTFVDETTAGTTTLKINDNTGAALDLSGVGFDRIDLAEDNSTDALTLATGANLLVSVDQTNLTLTTAASAGRSVNITLDHATTGTGVTLTDLTTTNFATVNVALGDATADYVLTDIDVSATTDLVVTGGGDLTVTDYTSLKSFNASAVTGAVTFSAVFDNKQITTGSGADSFTVNDADTTTLNIDGGSGVDTVVFTASDDFDAGTLNFTNIEKLDVSASGVVLAASQLTGKDYIIVADATTDTLAVNVATTVGETVDLSAITASLAAITVTGNTGADAITASSTYKMTINAGSGNDTITGGAGNDTISGEGGNDTINISSGGVDTVYLAATGRDSITGFGSTDIINVEALSGGDTDFESAEIKGTAENVVTKTAYIFSTDGTAANLTTAGTAVVSDFTSLSQVAAYLEERFNVADNDVAAFIVNVGSTTYVYDMNDADDTTINASDLTLVGVISQSAALTTANVSFTA
jgi:hypothetical protein